MTGEEALAILPPDVAARLDAQADQADLTDAQVDALVRLFGGPCAALPNAGETPSGQARAS